MKKSVFFLVAILMMGSLSFAQVNEDFSSLVADENIALDGWTNYAEEGTRVFIGKYYADDDNSYAQMSAYNSTEASEIAWLVTPSVNANSSVLTFRSKYGYNVGDVSSLWISTDFSGDVMTATWEELTFTEPTDGVGGYGEWVESGNVDLSDYDGETINVAFVYTGGDHATGTTTWQVDDVVITASANVNELSSIVSVYPNPAVDNITIANAEQFNSIKIVNIAGQVVYTSNNTSSVDVSNFQSGVYFIVLDGTVSTKFVK